jgi:acetyl-CoA carboxylase carboxyl transferase subunit beta
VIRLARHRGRPTTLDHATGMLDGFQELHGDRLRGDCPAVVGGIGLLRGTPVVLIGHQKGHTTGELLARNFGRATPAGQRKAARLMRLAAKLGLPLVTLVDTQGADPGPGAEREGQAFAVAENIRLMARLPVPIVAVITGEGGSGGALALAVADRVLVCANAFYSVISPEGCASILWRDAGEAGRAAAALALDAAGLLRHGIVDGVVPEPPMGADGDPRAATRMVADAVCAALDELVKLPPARLVAERRRRFGRYGDGS